MQANYFDLHLVKVIGIKCNASVMLLKETALYHALPVYIISITITQTIRK